MKINDFREISKDYLLARLETLSNEQRLARLPPVPITNTSVCNNIDVSIQDIPPVPIVDTPVCSNVNNNIQNIPSLLSDNVNPQQNPGALKVLFRPVFTIYCNKGVSFK